MNYLNNRTFVGRPPMVEYFDQAKVNTSFQKFIDYSKDVLNSNHHTFETKFEIFIYFCETDNVIKYITSPLKKIDVQFDDWWEKGQNTGGSIIGSKSFMLPIDEDIRDALFYQFCLKVKAKQINLMRYTMDFFGKKHLDDSVSCFSQEFVYPLSRSIVYKIKEIQESIKEYKPNESIPSNILVVYHVNNSKTDNSINIGDNNNFSGNTDINV